MLNAWNLARAHARALLEEARAKCVSIYVPSGARSRQPATLLHVGPGVPIAELADEGAAHATHAAHVSDAEADTLRAVMTGDPSCRLYLVSASFGRNRAATAVWIGMNGGVANDTGLAGALRLGLMLTATAAVHAREIASALEDPFLAIPNRTALHAALDRESQRSREYGSTFSVLMIDPDDFASLDERPGGAPADEILREIAARLRGQLREEDILGRYGGAILLCILSGTPASEAEIPAGRLLRRLSDEPYADGTVRLTFSIGMATSFASEEDVMSLVKRADQALSSAKRAGGGRIHAWTPESSRGQLDRLWGIFTGDPARDYRNMNLLWKSVSTVGAGLDLARIGSATLMQMAEATRAESAALLLTAEHGKLEAAHEIGPKLAESAAAARLRLAEVAVRSGRAESRSHEGRLAVALPLRAGDRNIGCVHIEGATDRIRFDKEDRSFLEALSGHMAVALDQARLAREETIRNDRERDRLHEELNDLRKALQTAEILYRSDAMDTLLATARRVAVTDATVLITGESGTGKEALARTLHALSGRRTRPLVIVDCGAISPALIESELFGHARGAFTGATERKIGRLVEAEGATVLLDEIGELPLAVQIKLLRFVQDKQVTPVGDTRAVTVDVRILAATNVDLRESVQSGAFRADLFHRLDVIHFRVPPLRDRREDVLPLARHFAASFAAPGGRRVTLGPEAEAMLLAHSWPGNVRELQNRVLRAVLLSDRDELGRRDFAELADGGPGVSPIEPLRAGDGGDSPRRALRDELGRQIEMATRSGRPLPLGQWLAEDLVLEAHDAASGVARQAAQLLGVPATTFRRRLRKVSVRKESGLLPRPDAWQHVRDLLAQLVRDGGDDGGDLLKAAEDALLEEIAARFPDDLRTGSALLGVTEPTFRRRSA